MLSISIVTYKPDVTLLTKLLDSLEVALSKLPANFTIDRIDIIENSNQQALLEGIIGKLNDKYPLIKIISPGKNIGYGAAHNLSILKSHSTYHLILNPDVSLDADALVNGLNYLETHNDVVALSPKVVVNGETKYLTKRYPSIFCLFIRSCGMSVLNRIFEKKLSEYENRLVVSMGQPAEVDIISGCFILGRTAVLQKVGGFDVRFFLYFEDFSLSLELSKYGKLVYCPAVSIEHYGGNASRKGIKHIVYFARSAWSFYNKHGWKFI